MIVRESAYYWKIFTVLVGLTLLTFFISQVHMPLVLEWVFAVGIMLTKIGLISGIFMHVSSAPRYFMISGVFLLIFFVVALFANISGFLDTFGIYLEGGGLAR